MKICGASIKPLMIKNIKILLLFSAFFAIKSCSSPEKNATKTELLQDSLGILLAPFQTDFYEDCANKVIFPANTLYDNIEISTKEAIISQDAGHFWLVPNANTAKIQLHLLGKKKGNIIFQTEKEVNIRKPPKAKIRANVNGLWTHIDSLKIGKDAVGAKFTIKIQPDSAFALLCPRDCQYEFTEVSVFIQNLLKERHKIGGADLSGKRANEGLDFPFHSSFFREVNESNHFIIKDIRRKKYNESYEICQDFSAAEKEIVVWKKKTGMEAE